MNKEVILADLIRLDHYIAECGIASRKQATALIRAGAVCVNGEIVKSPGLKIEVTDSVTCNGTKLTYERFVYYCLNKPAGVVTATKDNLSKTVMELLKGVNTKGLFPVGRLDKDTEGMLLITNDGDLCHELMAPRKHVRKTYYVISDGMLTDEDLDSLRNGIDIGDDRPCLPCTISYLGPVDSNYSYELTITEGRFHQVKRMFIACGKTVVFLKRTAIGGLELDEALKVGEFKKLTCEDLDLLKE